MCCIVFTLSCSVTIVMPTTYDDAMAPMRIANYPLSGVVLGGRVSAHGVQIPQLRTGLPLVVVGPLLWMCECVCVCAVFTFRSCDHNCDANCHDHGIFVTTANDDHT